MVKSRTSDLAPRMGIVGFGNMAEAIVGGLLRTGTCLPSHFIALERSASRKRFIKSRYHIVFAKDFAQLAQKSSAILMAVKPQDVDQVLKSLKPHYRGQLIVTIVTGITCAHYKKILGPRTKVIRVMPNAPAMIGHGASVLFASPRCTPRDRHFVRTIFSSLGKVWEINRENQFHAVTAVSGSGPAFLYHYARDMILAARREGLAPAFARDLVLQTIRGATEVLAHEPEDINQLIRRVASPKGTTEAGLKILDKQHFTKTITNCISAATRRAKALSK